jgi:hypothetical protein
VCDPLPHHRAAGQGNLIKTTFDQLTKSQHEVLGRVVIQRLSLFIEDFRYFSRDNSKPARSRQFDNCTFYIDTDPIAVFIIAFLKAK